MPESTRQLAAIMFTDIVGYSAMMQQSEQTALKAVEESLALQGPIIEEHRGKILKKMGDGVISIFSSTYDAVLCGIKLQKIFNKDSELQLKIAIHEGDVLIKDEDVFGDGINIAARIESLSVAGAILISDKVKSEIQNKNIETVSLGAFHLKNIDQPVHIHAVSEEALIIPKKSDLKGKRVTGISQRQKVMIGAISLIVIVLLGYNWQNIFGSSDDSSITKIAVVPFSTSDHEDIQYLGEGMMDILSNKFSMLPGLTSLDPQISYSLYNKAGTDFLNIIKLPFWQKNRYDYLVTGSVIQLGTVTKFIGKLLDAEGKEISVVELDCSNMDEVSTCVEQFSRQLISALLSDLKLDFSNQAPVSTDNWGALKEFMAAESARRSGDHNKAHGHYKKAVSIDSTFALAWLRGFTHNFNSFNGFPINQVNQYAYKLNTELQEYVLALNLAFEGKVPEAIINLERILGLYGDNIDVLYVLGQLSFWNGFINDDDIFKIRKYFQKILGYDRDNLNIENRLLNFELFKGNNDYIKDLYKKYTDRNISNIIQLNIKVANYNLTMNDTSYYKDYYEQFKSEINNNSELSLFNYLLATARPLALMGRLDIFTKVLRNEYYHHLLSNEEIYMLDFYSLITMGKISEAFDRYPERFFSYWSVWPIDILLEPSFNAIDEEIAKSILANLKESKFDPNDEFHRYCSAYLNLLGGNDSKFDEDVRFIELSRKKEYNRKDTEVVNPDFYFYRIKYNYYRSIGNDNNAKIYLDSLVSVMRYNFRNRGGLIWSPKFTEASIALEQGDVKKAKIIFENLEYWPWFLTYAPLKYKLALVYDQLGEQEKAIKYYKHFFSIYKDCDPFYQPNVAHARQRIAELEELIFTAK